MRRGTSDAARWVALDSSSESRDRETREAEIESSDRERDGWLLDQPKRLLLLATSAVCRVLGVFLPAPGDEKHTRRLVVDAAVSSKMEKSHQPSHVFVRTFSVATPGLVFRFSYIN